VSGPPRRSTASTRMLAAMRRVLPKNLWASLAGVGEQRLMTAARELTLSAPWLLQASILLDSVAAEHKGTPILERAMRLEVPPPSNVRLEACFERARQLRAEHAVLLVTKYAALPAQTTEGVGFRGWLALLVGEAGVVSEGLRPVLHEALGADLSRWADVFSGPAGGEIVDDLDGKLRRLCTLDPGLEPHDVWGAIRLHIWFSAAVVVWAVSEDAESQGEGPVVVAGSQRAIDARAERLVGALYSLGEALGFGESEGLEKRLVDSGVGPVRAKSKVVEFERTAAANASGLAALLSASDPDATATEQQLTRRRFLSKASLTSLGMGALGAGAIEIFAVEYDRSRSSTDAANEVDTLRRDLETTRRDLESARAVIDQLTEHSGQLYALLAECLDASDALVSEIEVGFAG